MPILRKFIEHDVKFSVYFKKKYVPKIISEKKLKYQRPQTSQAITQ